MSVEKYTREGLAEVASMSESLERDLPVVLRLLEENGWPDGRLIGLESQKFFGGIKTTDVVVWEVGTEGYFRSGAYLGTSVYLTSDGSFVASRNGDRKRGTRKQLGIKPETISHGVAELRLRLSRS